MKTNKEVVLLVDDDAHVRASIRRTLRGEHYMLLEAQNAESALKILSTMEVSVIICDQRMPGLKGLELLRILRDRYPHTVRIMLTGYSSIHIAVDAINKGEVFRYLTKPCDPLQLMLAIREAIAQREKLGESHKLLALAAMQDAYIAELEGEHPGILEVQYSETGAIVLDDDSPESQ